MRFLQIHGLGYSGTSLMNLLLDAVDGVRGLGEVYRAVPTDYGRIIDGEHNMRFPCYQCGNSCRFYDNAPTDALYEWVINKLPDTDILVDSSKITQWYAERSGPHVERVILAKYPHEFGYSCIGHHGSDLATTFSSWFGQYQKILPLTSEEVVVTYREMVTDPWGTCARIIQESRPHRSDWWDTDFHILGGNQSCRAQHDIKKLPDFFSREQYPAAIVRKNKYKGNHHKIFLDEIWRNDNFFCKDAIEYYNRNRADFNPVLIELGITGGVDFLIADIESTISQ
tara:strand:+ start:9090 stop:9938 length:849 start_codon:yes stop_codon:yes gene_type:complete